MLINEQMDLSDEKIEMTPEQYKRITRKHRSIPSKLRSEVKERDNDCCVKCGRYKNLEIHHIIPAYLGGGEHKHNLITLCRTCHKDAPDDPIKFFKWASTSLPTNMDASLQLTKIVVGLLAFNDEQMIQLKNLKEKYEFQTQHSFGENDVFKWIECFYKDMWKVYVSNDMKNLSIFFKEYISTKNKSNLGEEE